MLTDTMTRRLITCPQNRSVGKSTAAELMLTWLNRVGVSCGALDCDLGNLTLSRRYPDSVKFFDASKSESDFMRFLKAIPDLPVTVVDFPSGATHLILSYADQFKLAEHFEKVGIRPTFILFAADDSALKISASDTVRFFLDRADYVLIENPAKAESEAFKRMPLYKWLIERKTPTIRFRVISRPTIEGWESLERKTKRFLSLEMACNHEQFDDLMRGELQYFRDDVLLQLDAIADRLLPDIGLVKNKLAIDLAKRRERSNPLEDTWIE